MYVCVCTVSCVRDGVCVIPVVIICPIAIAYSSSAMIFHPDCGSRDFPSILSDDL